MQLLAFISETLADTFANPISLTIFSLIGALILFLLCAMVSETWRNRLVTYKILEEDERPSSLLLWIVTVVIVVKCIQILVIQPFVVDGDSMLPTFHNREFLFVDKLSSEAKNPVRGEVVVFKLYEGSSQYSGKHLIKRVIGLPGERVLVKAGVTTIYSSQHPEGIVLQEPYVTYAEPTKNIDVTLKDDEYFVMGDNRARSYDSRDWGPLHTEHIKGRVFVRVFPFGVVGYLPGYYRFEN